MLYEVITIRAIETNLGNLVADAMLWQATELHEAFGVKTPDSYNFV